MKKRCFVNYLVILGKIAFLLFFGKMHLKGKIIQKYVNVSLHEIRIL